MDNWFAISSSLSVELCNFARPSPAFDLFIGSILGNMIGHQKEVLFPFSRSFKSRGSGIFLGIGQRQ